MSSSKRSTIVLLVIGLAVIVVLGLTGGLRIGAAADNATGVATTDVATTGVATTGVATTDTALILSAQQPRRQDFFAGGDAEITVNITNTGSIAFQTVTVSGATFADCNRANLGALAPGQSTSYTCGQDNVNQSILNELQVNGSTGATTVNHKSNSFVKVLKPEVRITKTPQAQTIRQGATAFFTVTIYNTSDFVMTLEEVDDSLANDCDRNPTITVYLQPGDSIDYACSMVNVQSPQATVATVRVRNPVTTAEYTASDVAWVELLDLEAVLTPQPTAILEPGDLVTYTVELINTGSLPVTLVGLTTNKYGNILDPGNAQLEAADNTCLPQPTLPTLAPFGGSYACSFIAPVEGQPSDFSVILTATARSQGLLDVTATTNATVQIIDVPASMKVTLSADPPFMNPPSQLITFSVSVENTSGADAINILAITDEFLGDLNGRGNCELPVEGLPAGYSYQCHFSAVVAGEVGQEKSRTILVEAESDDLIGEPLSISEVVTVGITDQPTRYNYMPNVSDHTLERTSCARPYPLRLDTQYYFRPPNRYDSSLPVEQREQDYFTFTLAGSAAVRVELTNFVPIKGQLIVRPHVVGGSTPCGPSLGRNPDDALNKTVDLGTIPAGRYYIQLINDGPSNVPDLYGLFVRVD